MSRIYHFDILHSLGDHDITGIQNQIRTCFRYISQENLEALPKQGGFGLLNLRTQLLGGRCRMILHTLIGDQDWQFEIYRLKIQKFINKIQPPKQEGNHQQIVPWYKFLIHQNDELDKALSATRVLPTHLKTAIKAWIELNKPETRTPENDLYTTIDESYSPTKNYISKDFAPSTDTKYYNSSSKKLQLAKREVLTPLGWTERLDISTEQWKSTLEKLQQNGQK